MYKIIGFVLSILICDIGVVHAQNGAAVHTLPNDGRSPNVYINEIFNSFYDFEKGLIYWHTRDTLHVWDISERKWSVVRKTQLPSSDYLMDIDLVKNRILVWSRGVGEVFETDREWSSPLRRIDKSFNHKNQFEHGHIISPVDGQLITFGGYGFWQDKDLLAYFDEVNSEWDIHVWREDQSPSRRVMPSLSFWKSKNRIILLGGRVNANPQKPYVTIRKSVFDIWTFDLTRQSWEYHGDMVINPKDHTNHEIMLGYQIIPRIAHLQDEDLLIGLDYFNSHTRNTIMYAVDLVSMQGSFIDVPTGALSRYNRLLNYFLNEKTRELYLLWSPSLNDNLVSPLYISVLKLPPADSIRAEIQKAVSLSKNNWVEDTDESALGYVIPILLAGVAIPLIYWRRKRARNRNQISDDRALIDSDASIPVQFIYVTSVGNTTKLYFGEVDTTFHFSTEEIDMFVLLARQYETGNKYISTDQIEQSMWNMETNPDYSRKMRNQVQKKLEETLQIVFPKYDGSQWILSRNEPSDKRRKEYGLNPEPYKISFTSEL